MTALTKARNTQAATDDGTTDDGRPCSVLTLQQNLNFSLWYQLIILNIIRQKQVFAILACSSIVHFVYHG